LALGNFFKRILFDYPAIHHQGDGKKDHESRAVKIPGSLDSQW
jgi:hypothetical protein